MCRRVVAELNLAVRNSLSCWDLYTSCLILEAHQLTNSCAICIFFCFYTPFVNISYQPVNYIFFFKRSPNIVIILGAFNAIFKASLTSFVLTAIVVVKMKLNNVELLDIPGT